MKNTIRPEIELFLPAAFLDLEKTEHAAVFPDGEAVWTALPRIAEHLAQRLAEREGDLIRGTVQSGARIGDQVFVGEGAVIEANAVVQGPAWIGAGTVVRSGAYLRANVLAGRGCVLGNSSEFKNCLVFDDCEVPHFNYVGDSILGHRAHLGAGAICSNVRLDRRSIRVKDGRSDYLDTGLRKFGAILGDRAEVGCNSVLSPGSLLGRDCLVHPCVHWHGVLPAGSVARNRQPVDVSAAGEKR